MTPTGEQQDAIEAIKRWLDSTKPHGFPPAHIWQDQEFLLDGGAGTGKSTTAGLAVEALGLKKVVFGAYTAKAARVMESKGMTGATTLHRLLYKPEIEDGRVVGWRRNERSLCREADLIVVDECFSPDTLIDTPQGTCCISQLSPGDEIYNAWGVDNVVAVKSSVQTDALSLVIGGKATTCSRNHPFFTERGLILAGDLKLGDRIATTASSMRLLWDGLLSNTVVEAEILFTELFSALEAPMAGNPVEDVYRGAKQEGWSCALEVAQVWTSQGSGRDRPDYCPQSSKPPRSRGQDQPNTQSQGASASCPGGQWPWSYLPTDLTSAAPWAELGYRTYSSIGFTKEGRVPVSLQIGPSRTRSENSDRTGRPISHSKQGKSSRPPERQYSDWLRVDSIEVLEQGDTRLDKYRDAAGELSFYDLQAARHHSFSVNGALVHNCSMCPESIAQELRSYEKPILVLGDIDGQLPPPEGAGAFQNRQPDFRLHTLHRAAAENPITKLAWAVRGGAPLQAVEGDIVRIAPLRADAWPTILHRDNQVLCGKHTTRATVTRRAREQWGFSGLPQPGEPLICTQNNYIQGLLNGDIAVMWRLEDDDFSEPYYEATLLIDGEERAGVKVLREGGEANDLGRDRLPARLDFAYAITVHRSQGSEYDRVVFIDDHFAKWNRDLRRRFLYTAISRAREQLTIFTTG